MEKRGQGLSTNAIILIVLGVVVLAVLVIGFTMGWDKIAPWISTDNVDTIKTQCEVACSTSSTYDFCTKERTLKMEGEEDKEVTCKELAGKYGIEDCSGLCTESCVAKKAEDKAICEALTTTGKASCKINQDCEWK
jgi:hypothetical protein